LIDNIIQFVEPWYAPSYWGAPSSGTTLTVVEIVEINKEYDSQRSVTGSVED
jgi:hypothetical protein